jgi:ADP-heptose:LPS heptosyltransferase
MSTKKKILISIVCHNQLEMTKRCIMQVWTYSAAHDVVLLATDNASTDGTLQALENITLNDIEPDAFRTVVAHNAENQGFIPPNNDAYNLAQQCGADYLVLLNNDTCVPSGWLDTLLAPLEGDDKAAASGPRGGCSVLKDSCQGDMGDKLEYLEGSCLMLKMSALREICGEGPLFSDYLTFAYGEDADLSLRLQERGFTLHHVNLDIQHQGSATKLSDPALVQRCEEAEAKNHAAMRTRWAHWLKVRRFDYPIVVRRRAAHGDVLLTTPILRAIRQSYPCSPLYLQTDWAGKAECGFGHLVDVWLPMAADLPADALFVNLDGAYENRPQTHYVRAYEAAAREVLPALGPVELRCEFRVSESERAFAGAFRRAIGETSKLCAIHADSTGWPGRDWPFERFAEVSTRLRKAGWSVVFVGSQTLPGAALGLGVTDLTGQTNIGQLAAVLEDAQMFIGIDSFPMHLAQAVGCPVVGIFGMTSPEYVLCDGPAPHAAAKASPSIPCTSGRHRTVGAEFVTCSPDCIQSVTVDDVMAQAAWLAIQIKPTAAKVVDETTATVALDPVHCVP